MKNARTVFVIACAGLLVLAGGAMSDELSVTSDAAMGPGVAQNDCSGDGQPGPCGLEINHGATNTGASVIDESPDGEQIYRFSFIMNPNDMVPATQSLSTIVFRAKGTNPNPGGGRCPTNPAAQVDTIAIRAKFFAQGFGLKLFINDNFCGARGTPDVPISRNTPSKICGEVIHERPGDGLIAIAIVGENDTCPQSGDPAYTTGTNSNSSLMVVNRISMGIHTTHPASKHVNPIYFDEFESFRTLAP